MQGTTSCAGKKSKLAEIMATMCMPARMVNPELVFASIYATAEAGITQNLAGMLKASHSLVHECLFTIGMATG